MRCLFVSVVRHSPDLPRFLSAFLLALGMNTEVPAEDVFSDPRSLLAQMSHSASELNYHGTVSYLRGDTMHSLRMAHAVIEGKEYERLEYMDGQPREIVRLGHEPGCIHPGQHLMRFHQNVSTRPRPEPQTEQVQAEHQAAIYNGINQHYDLSRGELVRVADRQGVELALKPKDLYRFGYRLVLDQESGILLRSELVGAEGDVLERFQFVEVVIGEALPKDYFLAEQEAVSSYQTQHIAPGVIPAQAAEAIGGLHWTVDWLPAGFTTDIKDLKIHTGDMASFTDGLSGFSVFIEPSQEDEAHQGKEKVVSGSSRLGATMAVSQTMMLNDHPYTVTVVGEIPITTAKQIAQSVKIVAN